MAGLVDAGDWMLVIMARYQHLSQRMATCAPRRGLQRTSYADGV